MTKETIAKLMGMATYFISIPEYFAQYCKRSFMTSSNKKDEEKEDEENIEMQMMVHSDEERYQNLNNFH